MKRFTVTTEVEVQINEAKFTPEFLSEFRAQMYDFDGIDDHLAHLSELVAKGVITDAAQFVEGYGPLCDWDFKFEIVSTDSEEDPFDY